MHNKAFLNLQKHWYSEKDTDVELVPVTELLKFREFNRLKEAKYSKEDSLNNIKKIENHFKGDGITEPLIIEYSIADSSVLLIEGNHRLNVALELGIRYLPARVVKRNSSFPSVQKSKSFKVNGVVPNEYGYVRSNLKPSAVGIIGTKDILTGKESVYTEDEIKDIPFNEGGTVYINASYDDMKNYTLDVKKTIEDNGYFASHISYSKTDFGNSNYLYVSKIKEDSFSIDGLKVRISDHSVTNLDRMFSEIHLHYPPYSGIFGVKNALKQIDFKLNRSKFFKQEDGIEYYPVIMEVTESNLRISDEIISERLSTGRRGKGRKILNIKRINYKNIVNWIDIRDGKVFKTINKFENGGDVSFDDGRRIIANKTQLEITARKIQLRNKLASIIKNIDYKTLDTNSGKSKEDLFIKRVVDMIYNGYDFKSKLDIERVATKEFGFDDARKVRELTEYAILFVGRDISKDGNVKEVYDKLVSLYVNQPYSTNRTVKSQQLGQYSTPAPMAYLMGVYVGINGDNNNWIKDDGDVEDRYNHYTLKTKDYVFKITEYLIKDKLVKLRIMERYRNLDNEVHYSIDSIKEFNSVEEAKLFVSSLTNKSYIEPTGGNGMLSIAGNPSDFVINELDFNRYNNLLKDNYKQVLNKDASKSIQFDYKFDGLLANPPFATTKNNLVVDNFIITGLENQIIVHTLDLLKDNARGAFIVGGHTEYDSKGRLKSAKDRAFLQLLYSRYNLEDVINVSGMLYGRQGTTYPIRIILFNGRKSVYGGFYPLRNDDLEVYDSFSPKVVNNFEVLYKRFEKYL